MRDDEEYIELRLPRPGLVFVAVLGPSCPVFGFKRLFNQFRVRCERLPDGNKEEVHHLPCEDLIHEIELREGHPRRRYVATMKGSHVLHPISRRVAEVFAMRKTPLREIVQEYPEMPPIEVED